MEPLVAASSTFGVICLFASWILLLIVSFKEDFTWGLVTLFVPPLSYLYALFSLEKAGGAILFAAIGLGLILVSL
ncbi:MAG: hypothetical protein ACRBCI_05210 [Cellvibrionaceae bacterium]